MNEEFRLVHHKPLKDEIFDVIHERIIAGQYAAGEWLRQEDISTQLGVSMTPVREALDLLVSAGLAERVPYRGVRILKPSVEDIADSYGVRLLLESAAVHAAALHISSDQLDDLKDLLVKSRTLVNLRDMAQERILNRELHGAIALAAGSTVLYKMYITVLNTFPDWMLYEYMFRHPELLDESIRNEYEEHCSIVAALAEHNPDLAVQRSLEHLTNRGRELEKYLDVPGELIHAKEDQVMPLLARHARA